MLDDKLLIDEERRATQYEAVKGGVEAEVGNEILARADRTTANDSAKMNQIAGEMKSEAMDEVVDTKKQVETSRTMARISQFVDYAFFLLYALLLVRFVLALLAAKSNNGFVQFIKTISAPFYAPFTNIVPSPSTEGGFTLALPIVIALIAYAILHLAINGLLRIIAHRKVEV